MEFLRFRLWACLTGLCVCASAQDGGFKLPSAPPTPVSASNPAAGGPEDPTRGTATPQPLTPNGLQEGVVSAVDPNKFKIGAEDVLQITVWREPQLSGPVAVRPDGKISLTLIPELDVGGKTPNEVRQMLVDEYGKVMNDPVVTVQLTQIRSSKYYVTGMVNRSGMFPLVVDTTVLQALIMAGGLQEYANAKKILILRDGKDRIYFNYNDVSKGKNLQQNILLKNGDTIIVN
jgi:polysaccharide export outer membrane protein